MTKPTQGTSTTSQRQWRALLKGEDRARVSESLEEISKSLLDPPPFLGPAHCLYEGYSGLATFYAYSGKATENEGHLDHAAELLSQCIQALAEEAMDSGLMTGFTGIAWTVEHLRPLLFDDSSDPEEDDPNEALDQALIEALAKTSTPAEWPGGWDLMTGVLGLGVYALERYPHPVSGEIYRHVLRLLELRAERQDSGLAWFTPPEAIDKEMRTQYPEGYYNMGVAHGSPGVLGLLARASSLGLEPELTQKMIAETASWLLANRLAGRPGSSYPSMLNPIGDSLPARSAWCYGNPGIAPCFLAAGRVAGNPAWEAEGFTLAIEAAERSIEDAEVVDPGLCHGSVGLGHLFNRLYQATGDERLRDAAIFWYRDTLERRVPRTGVAGYRSYRAPTPHDPEYLADASFLTGGAGIGLAFLAATTDFAPQWDRLLLAEIPSPRSGNDETWPR